MILEGERKKNERHVPNPPARRDSWNTDASTTTPMPSVGGKMKPSSKRMRPKENPAKGPAAATFKRSSRLGTIFRILVIAPKEPICPQKSSLEAPHANKDNHKLVN